LGCYENETGKKIDKGDRHGRITKDVYEHKEACPSDRQWQETEEEKE
jgi:hypothetical protein